MVSGDSPALRANSALLIRRFSLNFFNLFFSMIYSECRLRETESSYQEKQNQFEEYIGIGSIELRYH